MSVVAAVGTDTYGGLSGFRRPVQGNPTRVPTNLPAFRGVTNKPGSTIKAPAIKSSANKPDRKTNVLIPYARVTPVEFPADIGRTQPGDVLFVSKTRPGVPGYAHARESRVCGVDALNKWLSPLHWMMKNEAGDFRYILVDPFKLADDWRKVPLLQEWTLDGICLSNEDRDLYRGSMSSQRDGQLYNIGIQGPCMVNNGYVEEHSAMNGLMMLQQGQVARTSKLYAPGYMDNRVETFGKDKVEVPQKWDLAADYQGPQYHLYPLQMFGRDARPMQDLYVGLVATEYSLDDDDVQLMKDLATTETALKEAERLLAADPTNEGLKIALRTQKKELKQIKRKPNFEQAFTAKTAYDKMGWWDAEKGELKANANDDPPPKRGFAAFRYVLFTSGHAWELSSEADVATMAAEGEPKMAKRRKLTEDPFDDAEQRKKDFQRMVGAWHIGKIMDMKAGKMPYFEGGPMETGYRLTVNVSIEWLDWRALRRTFTPAKSPGIHIGELCDERWENDPADKDEQNLRTALFQWPTRYVAKKLGLGTTAAAAASSRTNRNIPVSMDDYEKLRGNKLYNVDSTDPFDFQKYVQDQRVNYWIKYKSLGQRGDAADTGEEDIAAGFLSASGRLSKRILNARRSQLPAMPRLEGNNALHVATTGIARLRALLAPVTAEERAGNGPSIDLASFVVAAPTAPSVPSAPSAPSAPIRRRAANTPSPSPDRTGTVSPSIAAVPAAAPVAAPAPALPAVIEAPSAPSAPNAPAAPAAGGTKKRRQAAASADVFSSIFGGSSDTAAPQPLNPAHRAEGGASGASGASTGRSYQRRGKGSSSKE